MYQKLIAEFQQLHQTIEPVWYNYLTEYELGDDDDDVYLPDLELHDKLTFDGFDYWMREDKYREKEATFNQHFAGFGQSGDGSTVAIWLMENKKVLECPVVLIGSEGELGIISPDYLTFLQLSAMGYDMYQLIDWQPTKTKPDALPIDDFLNYLKTTFKLSPIEEARIPLIIEKAKKGFPDFETVVNEFFSDNS